MIESRDLGCGGIKRQGVIDPQGSPVYLPGLSNSEEWSAAPQMGFPNRLEQESRKPMDFPINFDFYEVQEVHSNRPKKIDRYFVKLCGISPPNQSSDFINKKHSMWNIAGDKMVSNRQ